jgi:hypothetical protein
MTDTMNSAARLHRNGRTEPSECRCPACQSIIPPDLLASIIGAENVRRLDIEQTVAARFAKQIAEAETKKKGEIAKAVKAATVVAETKIAAIRHNQAAVVVAALTAERIVAGQKLDEAVSAEKLAHAAEKLRLETALADMQRKLQGKTAHQLGEPFEASLYDTIVAALPPSDVARRVEKGQPGVDVIVEVVHGESVVGKIVLDSKNHARWQNAFTRKLRADQLAENADFGILSSTVFPKGASQLYVQDGVIIADPERVAVLVTILRRIIIDNHIQKRGSEARNEKADALFTFLLSRRADDLFLKMIRIARDLETLDEVEVKSHRTTWAKRAELVQGVVDVHDTITSTIADVVGGGL